MDATRQPVDREATARRLLLGSVKRSYDPDVDIDWDAPLVEGKFFTPPSMVTLYGTRLWDELSHEQRVEISRQEMINTVSVGIWFENILNQMLLRMTYEQNPTRAHVHYAWTELGDECRHMTMFGRLIEKAGGRPYRQGFVLHNLGRVLPFVLTGPSVWVAALVGEEIFDALQRITMNDDDLQPLVRQVMRIHVTEESRHIRFAREDLTRRLARSRWPERALARLVAGIGTLLLKTVLTRPEVFRRAGLDSATARRARREARKNPHRARIYATGFEKLRAFLHEQGVIAGPSRLLWRASGLHPDGKAA
ncbi:AurF N-oxygenase family protein [Amycolatopsis samaneae]|uniref:Diiron oxygenase n=1 Tax=Amycolatopsis samaneae TaxID=664691 RepID=A0ABW5GVM8_9PSEU